MKTIFKYLLITLIVYLVIIILKRTDHYDGLCYFVSYLVGGINLAILLKD